MIFQKWLKIIKDFKNISDMECPHCNKKSLDYLYIGDEETKIGYLQAWCNNCLNGIHISRVKIPDGAKMLPFDTKENLNEIIPTYQKVTPEE